MDRFDVVVIGGGPGGYPAAIGAAQKGRRTALVEREALGGTCLNWGCIPTKSLIASANRFFTASHAGEFGVLVEQPRFDYGIMKHRADQVVDKLRQGVGGLLKAHGVTVIRGTASFSDARRLSVKSSDGGVHSILAGATIIACGGKPAIPGFIPTGREHAACLLDSRRFLALDKLPSSLLVCGGGIIGCEFACMAAQLGVEVTVVELLDDILPLLDRDVRGVIRGYMENKLGIRILCGTGLDQVKITGPGVSADRGGEKLKAQAMLMAIGRQPATAALKLEQAGIATDQRGAIEVDDWMRTSAPGIFAVGDAVAGSTQLAHAATSQGMTAAANACGARQRAESVVPACIFTTPEAASAGLTEDQAARQERATISGKFPFSFLGKALAENHPEGFVKWVADGKTGQLLGAQVVGAHATELIAAASLAIRNELTFEELAKTIVCHPTMSEAWMEAAHVLAGDCVHQPPAKRKS